MSKEKRFIKVYNDNVEKIYRFVYLKVDSREEAQDLTSETFLKTWRHLNQGESEIKNIQAFLFKTARNLVIDFYRQKPKREIPMEKEIITIIDDKNRGNLTQFATLGPEIEEIKKSLTEIRKDYADIVIWHYLDELSIKEISEILDKSKGAIRVMLSRALKDLREKLEK